MRASSNRIAGWSGKNFAARSTCWATFTDFLLSSESPEHRTIRATALPGARRGESLLVRNGKNPAAVGRGDRAAEWACAKGVEPVATLWRAALCLLAFGHPGDARAASFRRSL